jgi:hypothetical protein
MTAPQIETLQSDLTVDIKAYYADLYQQTEDRLFPRPETEFQRLAPLLQAVGAVVLGGAIASLSILALFILLNLILHYHP